MTVPSPPARRLSRPRWLDARVLAGLVLVLLSVVVGAQVVSAASRTTPVWSAARDLPVGTVVGEEDLRVVEVRLDDASASTYLGPQDSPAGRVLSRPVAAGELLASGAVTEASRDPRRRVAVPVDALHSAADVDALLDRRVDVFASVDDGAVTTRAVLRGATVVDVRAGGAGGELAVVVLVAPQDVPELVAAVRSATLDVVVVQGEGADVPSGAVRFDVAAGEPGEGGPAGQGGDSSSTDDAPPADAPPGDAPPDDAAPDDAAPDDAAPDDAAPGDGAARDVP